MERRGLLVTGPKDGPIDPGTHGLTEDEVEVRRAAFRSILSGRARDAGEIAEEMRLGVDAVERAMSSLVRRGQAIADGAGHIVASAGLSLVPARHRLRLGQDEFYTWCAIDAIGIPAALGVDAVARTSCPTCDRPIELEFREGNGPLDSEVRAWLPQLDCCTSVVDELCPDMNLFCSDAHLNEWRLRSGDPAGTVLSLEETEELGWRWWGDLA